MAQEKTRVLNWDQVPKADLQTIPLGWGYRQFLNEDNLAHLIFHEQTREAILVDPVKEDHALILSTVRSIQPPLLVLYVLDTHTHADHVSGAADLALALHVPYVMHERSPTRRATLRMKDGATLPASPAPVQAWTTPGHSEDGLTLKWGPFLITGDTVLYGDTGRDDLPGGDAVAHYESLQKIKRVAGPELVFLTNHDGRGRISSWGEQLRINGSLTQERAAFIKEASEFRGPEPRKFKESIAENTK